MIFHPPATRAVNKRFGTQPRAEYPLDYESRETVHPPDGFARGGYSPKIRSRSRRSPVRGRYSGV